jgi:hypothetical protein
VAKWLPICAPTLAIIADGGAGCSAPESSAQIEALPRPAKPAVPPEIVAVATASLGQGAEVVAFGDLAHNGRQQVLVANRAGGSDPIAKEAEPEVRFTRAAVLEKEGTKWTEVLRRHEHGSGLYLQPSKNLKNPNGYLGGIPLEPVAGWRLEFSKQRGNQERELFFTPLPDSGATSIYTVVVRWNQDANRYQSVDSKNGLFFAELPSLQTPVSHCDE